MAYRQTNHNGRVSAKTGSVYNRNHNDRQFDVTHADNIHAEMVSQNIIIHYDANNRPTVIESNDPNRKSIDEHEHEVYEALFSDSLSRQHARNEAARHPERNKTIDDLLNNKNTCPEETIFQIGSVDDGHPPVEVLMAIFEDYQQTLIERYGNNLHFLDVALHMDEAVPHLHIRKVWTYKGKDGLDISQNKALTEMGFDRPHPEKSSTKWNNAKVSFSKWEREIKLEICRKHGISVEYKPKTPGKSSLEKEEAIALKLQEKIDSLSSELISEEEKQKVVSDTNLFGKPRMITITPQEYRRWQASAESKKEHERLEAYFKEQKKELDYRERRLEEQGRDIANKKLLMESEIRERVEKGIQKQLPDTIKSLQLDVKIQKQTLESKEKDLISRERHAELKEERLDKLRDELATDEENLNKKSKELKQREANLDAKIKKSVTQIIKEKFMDFFETFKSTFTNLFKSTKQDAVLSVIKDVPIPDEIADRLFQYGFCEARTFTVGEVLELAKDDDIREALHEAGAGYKQIKMSDINAVKDAIKSGGSLDDVIDTIAKEASNRIVPTRKR